LVFKSGTYILKCRSYIICIAIARLLGESGVFIVVVQLLTQGMDEITETPFKSIYVLDGFMRLVDVDWLSSRFKTHGFSETLRSEVMSEPGKRFCVLHFTRFSDQTEQDFF
jgi:hypothetical protein